MLTRRCPTHWQRSSASKGMWRVPLALLVSTVLIPSLLRLQEEADLAAAREAFGGTSKNLDEMVPKTEPGAQSSPPLGPRPGFRRNPRLWSGFRWRVGPEYVRALALG